MASILPFAPVATQSIARLEAAWRLAVLEADVQVLDELLDEHYLFIGPQGDVTGKAHDLRAHAQGAVHIWRMDVLDSVIIEHVNLATVQLAVDLEGDFCGARFSGQYRYLRSWLRKREGWCLVSGSCTLMPPPSEV